MKRPKRDPGREDRIHNEAIADANGREEQAMGWHCYPLELHFTDLEREKGEVLNAAAFQPV